MNLISSHTAQGFLNRRQQILSLEEAVRYMLIFCKLGHAFKSFVKGLSTSELSAAANILTC